MSNGGIFSIGHSTHPIGRFIRLLNENDIQVVIDVRSSPFSKFSPQFNRENISEALRDSGLMYAFFGKELGARVEDQSCYIDGKVQYDRLADRVEFKEKIERLRNGARDYRIALMCVEKDPLMCHRTILVSQALVAKGCNVRHIMADGSLETHEAVLDKLISITEKQSTNLFKSKDELLAEKLLTQESRIAYVKKTTLGHDLQEAQYED